MPNGYRPPQLSAWRRRRKLAPRLPLVRVGRLTFTEAFQAQSRWRERQRRPRHKFRIANHPTLADETSLPRTRLTSATIMLLGATISTSWQYQAQRDERDVCHRA
jgi:hypothetical protein